jgi:hypothetical protein
VAALLALGLLGIFTKRTLLPEILLLAALGCGWTIVRLAHAPPRRAAWLGVSGLLLTLVLGARGLFDVGRVQYAAADWNANTTTANASRVLQAPGTGQAALELRPALVAVQSLPDIAAEWAQNQNLHVSARVWTAAGTAQGRLTIDFGWATTEVPFAADGHGQIVQAQTFVPLYCPYVHVAIRSDTGTIYADRLSAESDRRRGLNLLTNNDLAEPAISAGAPLERLQRYLRARELAWVWRSGRLFEPPPLGWNLGRIFFVSFWGQFGWMSLPLVGATPWEGALGMLCLGGLLGTLGWLASPGRPAWQRRAIMLLLLLIAAGLLFPLLNAYTQPRNQVIQQGRYLFPALAPLALLLTLGWRALLPPRWRAGALAIGLAFGAIFAGVALQLIVGFYHSH